MSKKITLEAIAVANGKTRYHFVIHSPKVGAMAGHRGWSRSLNTWTSKRAALAAGRRAWKENC